MIIKAHHGDQLSNFGVYLAGTELYESASIFALRSPRADGDSSQGQ